MIWRLRPSGFGPRAATARATLWKQTLTAVLGLVPAPASGDQTKYLKADGTWGTPSGGGSLPTGGTIGQVLTKKSNADGDADWETPPTYTRKQIIDKLVLANTYTAYDITITGLEPNTTYTLRETNQSPNLEYSSNSGSLTELEDAYYFHSGATINVVYSTFTKAVTLDSYVKIIDVGLMPTWADGTDAQIAALIARADAGEIDLYTDAGWRVGDERVVSLSAIEATGSYEGVSWTVNESYPAQNVTLVLMDAGDTSETNGVFANTAATNYSFVTAVKNKDQTTRTNPAFLVGLKDCPKNNGSYICGYINAVSGTGSGWSGTWQDCARRIWCNTAFRQALPSTLRDIFKQINVISAGSRAGATNAITQDYFSLPAITEIYGTTITRGVPNAAEAAALKCFEYFNDDNKAHRVIGGYAYFTRSLWKDEDWYWTKGYQQTSNDRDRATNKINYPASRIFGAI